MHLIFTTEAGFAKEKGKAYANPDFFSQVRSGVDLVTICGDYPAIVAAYEAVGAKVKTMGSASSPAPTPTEKGATGIRKGPRGLFYGFRDGERVTDGFATQEEALAALTDPDGGNGD